MSRRKAKKKSFCYCYDKLSITKSIASVLVSSSQITCLSLFSLQPENRLSMKTRSEEKHDVMALRPRRKALFCRAPAMVWKKGPHYPLPSKPPKHRPAASSSLCARSGPKWRHCLAQTAHYSIHTFSSKHTHIGEDSVLIHFITSYPFAIHFIFRNTHSGQCPPTRGPFSILFLFLFSLSFTLFCWAGHRARQLNATRVTSSPTTTMGSFFSWGPLLAGCVTAPDLQPHGTARRRRRKRGGNCEIEGERWWKWQSLLGQRPWLQSESSGQKVWWLCWRVDWTVCSWLTAVPLWTTMPLTS